MPPRRPQAEAARLRAIERQQKAQRVWDENEDVILQRLLEATNEMQQKWGYCEKCHKKVPVDFPDTRARIEAARALREMGYGSPRGEPDTGQGGFVVRRVIVRPDGVDGPAGWSGGSPEGVRVRGVGEPEEAS